MNHSGMSAMEELSLMSVGDVLWKEFALEDHLKMLHKYNPPQRPRPDRMKSWVFKCSTFQAVCCSSKSLIPSIWLLKVERVK